MKHTWYIYAVAAAAFVFIARCGTDYEQAPSTRRGLNGGTIGTVLYQTPSAGDNFVCVKAEGCDIITHYPDGTTRTWTARKGDEIEENWVLHEPALCDGWVSVSAGYEYGCANLRGGEELVVEAAGVAPTVERSSLPAAPFPPLRRASCAEDRAATADLDSGVSCRLGPPLPPSAVGLDLRGGAQTAANLSAIAETDAALRMQAGTSQPPAPLSLPGEGCEGCTYSGGGMAPVSKDLDGDGAPDLTMNLLVLKQSDGTCAQSPGCPHGQDCWSSEKAGAVLPNGWSYYLEVLKCDGSLDHDHLGAVNNSGAPKSFPGSIDTTHGVECDDCGKYRLRAEPASGPPIYSGIVTTNCSDCVESEE